MNSEFNPSRPVTYGKNELIFKIEALVPKETHVAIMKGISVAMRESLFMESLTQEERAGLAALSQFGFQIIPVAI